MTLKVLPGGLFATAPSLQCPKCNGARCEHCDMEGTREGFDTVLVRRSLALQLMEISNEHLTELAITHALGVLRSLRSPRARYVVGLLEELCTRIGLNSNP